MDPQAVSDSSDQKASKLLIESLRKLTQTTPKKPSSTKPMKSTQPKKRLRKVDNNSKITTWLNKRPKKENPEPLDITVTKKTKSKTLTRSASFEKYGVRLPSFEKILADHKKFEEHKKNVEQLDVFDENIFDVTLKNDCLKPLQPFNGEILDCKHLSTDELNEAFDKYVETMRDIMSEKKYSERHNMFYGMNKNVSNKDLTLSPILIVFTQDQIEHLLSLIQAEFAKEGKPFSYFYKVLMPELCLLIFMNEHNMTMKSANQYLNERPLD